MNVDASQHKNRVRQEVEEEVRSADTNGSEERNRRIEKKNKRKNEKEDIMSSTDRPIVKKRRVPVRV